MMSSMNINQYITIQYSFDTKVDRPLRTYNTIQYNVELKI